VLFFLHGAGANGKSTFLNTMIALMGDYGRQLEPELLMQTRNEKHPTGMADLEGSRFAVATEIEDGRWLAESRVKQLTGGDRMAARHVQKDNRQFWPSHTLWLGANHRPQVRGTDNGIWRRMRLIPFNISVPPERQDKELGKRLLRELPGILAWAITGCVEWQAGGLQEPDTVRLATQEYRDDEDTLSAFLTEHCQKGPE
jgi:putative DNA primase/helicase